jgi:hypothetical protein
VIELYMKNRMLKHMLSSSIDSNFTSRFRLTPIGNLGINVDKLRIEFLDFEDREKFDESYEKDQSLLFHR